MKKALSILLLVTLIISSFLVLTGCEVKDTRSAAEKIFDAAGCNEYIFKGMSQEEVKNEIGTKFSFDEIVEYTSSICLYYDIELYGMSAYLRFDFSKEDSLKSVRIALTAATEAQVRQIGKTMAEEAIAARESSNSYSFVEIKDNNSTEIKYESIEEFVEAWPKAVIDDIFYVHYYAYAGNSGYYGDTFFVIKTDVDRYWVELYCYFED